LDNLPLATQNLARVAKNGSIIVRHADIGQNQAFNAVAKQICQALGPVCAALKGNSLAKLFGVAP
jgi:butyrate kinase